MAVFVLLGALLWVLLSGLLKFKESYHFKDVFYKEAGNCDVLFFGASHPHNAIDPLLLWDEYGITSYNRAASGEPIALTYFALKSGIETANPKVVVVDIGKISDDVGHDHVHTGESHKTLDAIPFGNVKKEAVRYLVDTGVTEDPWDFLSNMYTYHSRVYELDRYDFEVGASHAMGWDKNLRIVKSDPPVLDKESRKEIKGGEGVKAYEKIIKLCKEKNVKLLLTMIPGHAGYYSRRIGRFNALADYTKEQGFDAIDLNDGAADMELNYDYDFASTSHMNVMGAEKVSRYFGKILKDMYGLQDMRKTESRDRWEGFHKGYADDIIRYLGYENEATAFLMMSKCRDLETEVYIRDKGIVDNVYALSYILDFLGIEAIEAGDEILGEDKDVLIRVYDRNAAEGSRGNLRIEKSFIYNEEEMLLTTTGEATERVNYFPEVEE